MEFLKKYVWSNGRLKILSLILAFMLWFATTYLGESHVTMAVPVQLVNLNRNCMTRTADTKEVLVTLNGPLSVLKNVKPSDIRLVLDIGRLREGRQIVTVRKSDIIVPKNIKVEEVKPDYVVLEIDRTVEKYLSVIVKLDESLAREYRVVSFSPRHALIEGPRQILEERAYIETLPLTRESLTDDGAIDAALNTRDLCAKRVSPAAVRVVLKKAGKQGS